MPGMKPNPERKLHMHRILKIIPPLWALLILFPTLNYRQLVSAWIIHTETQRLARLAAETTHEFQNPGPAEDRFAGRPSSQFWKFTTINGAGQVSNDPARHAAAMTVQPGLSLQHFPNPEFKKEDQQFPL
jgi:hypothetical protein